MEKCATHFCATLPVYCILILSTFVQPHQYIFPSGTFAQLHNYNLPLTYCCTTSPVYLILNVLLYHFTSISYINVLLHHINGIPYHTAVRSEY